MNHISIIVPALDEADTIEATLAPLQGLRAQGHQIIVVDGGSRDATLQRAARLADRAFVATRGRAAQMNAGAAAAAGDILLFLHVDTRIEPAAVASLSGELSRSGRPWGRFDVTIAGRRALRIVAAMMNLRSRLTGIATGDQAIFVERALFRRVGGYPNQPLMEDIALSQRLKRAGGTPCCLRTRVLTSGRRWEQHGLLRTIVRMWGLRFAYWLGVDPRRLAARYANVRAGSASDSDAISPMPTRQSAGGAPTLQVFAKAPVPGAVKTRLARTIGDAAAAAVHAELVERTLAIAAAARSAGSVGAIELWCAPDAMDPAFALWRERYGITLATQVGADLGERMRHALDTALRHGRPAILIGTDCPVLDAGHLANAAQVLESHDAVFAPAEDGGYVLVGLSRPFDAFTGIAWGELGVMAATRARLAAGGATWSELPTVWDVDDEADLARWRTLAAPSTAAPTGAAMVEQPLR